MLKISGVWVCPALETSNMLTTVVLCACLAHVNCKDYYTIAALSLLYTLFQLKGCFSSFTGRWIGYFDFTTICQAARHLKVLYYPCYRLAKLACVTVTSNLAKISTVIHE